MKIELWSDYACPFCYIGEKRLEKAIQSIMNTESAPDSPSESEIKVEFRSFELDPSASTDVVSSTTERFAKKYGLSSEDAAGRIETISQMGRTEGIDFRYAYTRYTNTFDSLRLTKYAQEKGHPEIVEKLFDAYFTKNLELSDHETLVKIAAECGLDPEDAEEVLKSGRYASEVRLDEDAAMRLGIHAVPYFLINGTYGFSGAQPVETIRDELKKILDEERGAEKMDSEAGMVCGSDGCRLI